MRVSAPFSVLLLVGSLTAGGLAGQVHRPLGPPTTAFGPASAVAPGIASSDATWKHRLLTGLGSAALGSGLGFFASQVSQSDWEEVPGQTQASRGLWAALGGGLGFAVGFSLPASGRSSPRDGLSIPAAGGRSVVTLAEIRDVSVDNAYDIVRLLRPEWLRVRPPDQFGEIAAETITVYLDDFRYGDIDSLHGVHVQSISSLRFIPAATATARWGTGHIMGVIQIITVG